MSALTKGQQRFAGDLSRETGLDPRVIGAWLLAEENGSAAANYERRGYHNWLNIARTDSGDAHGAHSNVWANPASAARATAEWLRGQGPITREYGHAPASIRAILSTAGKGAEAQIRAISGSGWASSHYNGGATLRSLVHTIGNARFPADATAGSPGGQAVPGRLSVQTTSSPGEAAPGALSALLEALKARQGPQYLGSPRKPGFAAGTKTPVGLPEQAPPDAQALAEQLIAAAPRNVESRVTATAARAQPAEPHGRPAGNGYPLAKHGKIIGTPYAGTHTQFGNWESDNAVDIAVPKGTPVYATEGGVIGSQIGPLSASNPQLAGLRLHLNGRNQAYYAHLSRLAVKAGQRVQAGQLLGYSGEANGVQHLHFAVENGSPYHYTGR